MKRYLSRSLQNALIVVLMAALWALFAPRQFGGSATYVIVAGASMEPTLHQGDLVITRHSASYGVGEIATYSHPKVGPVIHRIIDREGPYYTLQGDNNDWVDSYTPTASEVLGKSWLHIPGAAEKLLWLRSSAGLSLLSLSVGLMVMITLSSSTENEEVPSSKAGDKVWKRWINHGVLESLENWLFPLGVILIGSVLLGLFAFTKPLTISIPDDIPYEHRATFTYQAPAVPSLYSGKQVQTGDSIFHDLIPQVDLSYSYSLLAVADSDIDSTTTMVLRISEANGWKREIPLKSETTFKGNSQTTTATIDIQQITRYLAWVRDRTGLERGVFNLDVVVRTDVTGKLDGQPFTDQFSPILQFKLDELQLYPDGKSLLAEDTDPLNPTAVRYLPHERTIANTLNILGVELSVLEARRIVGIAGGASLILILAILISSIMLTDKNEPARIHLQFRDLLLDVNSLPDYRRKQVIDVEKFDDLAKFAQTQNALILHLMELQQDTYILKANDTVYRYTHKSIPTEGKSPGNPRHERGEERG